MQYQIIQGDCLERLRDVADGSVDMILADLPYGTTACKWDTVIPFEPLWRELRRVTKPDAAMCFFAQAPFDKALGQSNISDLKYEWIWEKPSGTGFLNCKKAPLKAHENVLVFYRKAPTYNPQLSPGKPYKATAGRFSENYGAQRTTSIDNPGFRYPKTVLKYPPERGQHPTQKPVPLLEYLVKTYTNEGDTVLDPTMGSGSTGVAALKCGRKFIGIEKDEDYVWIAEKRLKYEAELHAAIRAPMPEVTP